MLVAEEPAVPTGEKEVARSHFRKLKRNFTFVFQIEKEKENVSIKKLLEVGLVGVLGFSLELNTGEKGTDVSVTVLCDLKLKPSQCEDGCLSFCQTQLRRNDA